MGTFHMQADGLRNGGFPIGPDGDGNVFKDLKVMYSTAAYPILRDDDAELYPKGVLTNLLSIEYHYEQQETGQAAMEFSGTDAASGASISVTEPLARERAGPGGRHRDGRHGLGDADRVLERFVRGDLQQHALGYDAGRESRRPGH